MGVGVFEDRIEAWEQNAIDGKGTGARINLTDVKKDKSAKFKLQEKYKDMHFVDKSPEPTDGDVPEAQWEHRKILGLGWEIFKGWRLETKIHTDLAGSSALYLVNDELIRMIRDSPFNTKQMRSRMPGS